MNHNLKKIVRRVLMESLTESEPLWYRLSDNTLNELGIKLYNPNDEAYVVEIHFDTKNIFIQLYTEEFNELVPYWDSEQVPRNVKDTFTIPFSEIPRSLKSIIARRLDPKYHKYL